MSPSIDRLRLPASPDSARVARNVAESLALRAGSNIEQALDAAVVTSELVSNAVRVASAAVVVRFALDGHTLRIEVEDDGVGRPHLIEGSEDGGFGLRLVDQLSARWGCDVHPGAKTVWAELDQTGSSPSLKPTD
jgi:anti-sigma regulatory factor (Ser/Thr protein kinase)